MPRKTKETNEEKAVKVKAKLDEQTNNFTSNILDSNDQVMESKKSTPKARSKSTSTAKTTTKAKTGKVKTSKAVSKNKIESVTPKKATTKKSNKISVSKTTSSKSKSKSTKTVAHINVEYYDLPYKYNQTVVKVLYQNPTTLFVYWEISDTDIENYKNTYGENFFETTRPVLVVYNEKMNYSFEVNINDFANSWYFNINDSKCNYRVELIRRPIVHNEKIKTDYIYITSSNKIETPNDRILFSTNEPYTVYFRNTKNNNQRKVNLPKLLEDLNLSNKSSGFPIVRNVYDLYKYIYHVEDVKEFSVSLANPSSGNPSSHSLSSRFI